MKKTTEMMTALIADVACDKPLDKSVLAELCDLDTLRALYRAARYHDVAQLVAAALEKYGVPLPEEAAQAFEKEKLLALYRCTQIECEQENLKRALDEGGFPHILLKGAVLRKLYGEAWMRTSCDIDILVRRQEAEAARAYLEKSRGYELDHLGSHDVTLTAPSGVSVELHHELIEEEHAGSSALQDVWKDAYPVGETREYEMPDAVSYCYFIAHAGKHMTLGGCGVRTILDIWILEHRCEHSDAERNEMLRAAGLLEFADAARALAEYWFGEGEETPLVRQLAAYVSEGGMYGSLNNVQATMRIQGVSGLQHLSELVFLPRKNMELIYPELCEHPNRLFWCHLRRWTRILLHNTPKRLGKVVQTEYRVTHDEIEKVRELMDELHLL